MFPEVHLNFDSLAFDRLHQFFLPFVPGAILVGGGIVLRPEVASWLLVGWVKHFYVWLGIMAVAAYIAGWVLYAASAVITGIVTGVLSLPLRKRTLQRNNQQLSQRATWRKVAEKFLGHELAPIAPPNVNQSAEQMSPGQMGTVVKKTFYGALKYDLEWNEWYNILQDYLLKDVPLISSEVLSFFMALEATGWAIACLFFASSLARHWEFYFMSATFILIGLLVPFGAASSYLTSDRLTYWVFTARLLAEVRGTGARQVSSVDKKGKP